MKALTYIEHGKFALLDKPKPEILDPRDAVVRVTLGSICTSDLHIKHGSVPRAVPGITVGHEMVGVVESVGSAVTTVKPGDRVTVNPPVNGSPETNDMPRYKTLLLLFCAENPGHINAE